jgi:hypothetical protein
MIKKDFKFKKDFNNKESRSNRNVSIASAISSKARIKLHKLLMDIQKDGGRILYTDTDSAFAAYNKNDFRENLEQYK